VKLLAVPYRLLYPAILLVCCIGVYSINRNPLDIFLASLFGFLGYAFQHLRCEPAPLLLGFILGPMLEENLRRAFVISHGDPMVFLQRPISCTFLALTAVLVVILAAPMIRAGRERVFQEGEA
jgi:putative tricarboxylic transport membrane protein